MLSRAGPGQPGEGTPGKCPGKGHRRPCMPRGWLRAEGQSRGAPLGIMSPCVQATGPPGEKLLEYEPQGRSVGLGMRRPPGWVSGVGSLPRAGPQRVCWRPWEAGALVELWPRNECCLGTGAVAFLSSFLIPGPGGVVGPQRSPLPPPRICLPSPGEAGLLPNCLDRAWARGPH